MAHRERLAAVVAKPDVNVSARSGGAARREAEDGTLWAALNSHAMAWSSANSVRRESACVHAAAECHVLRRSHRAAACVGFARQGQRSGSRDGRRIWTTPKNVAA